MSESAPQKKKRPLWVKILIVVGALLLIPVGFFGWLFSQFPSDQGKRVAFGRDVVGIHSIGYAWLLRTKQGAILVDAGVDKEAKAIKAELQAMKLKAGDLSGILLTHGHSDHISGAIAFPKTKVWLGAGEIGVIQKTRPAGGLMQRTFSRWSDPIKLPQQPIEVKDGQELTVGGESFRVIHTPGHTQGSVSYLWKRKGILFVGDTFLMTDESVRMLPSIMMEDITQARVSLRKLAPFAFSVMADGHAGIHEKAKQKIAAFLKQ